MKLHIAAFLGLVFFLFSSCSSSKRIMLVSDMSNLAYSELEEANQCIISGKYDRAEDLLNSAFKKAWSVDNTELLCKVMLSGIVLKISTPIVEDEGEAAQKESQSLTSFLYSSPEEILSDTKKLAGRHGDKNTKNFLSNLCLIYEVRVNIEKEKSQGNLLSSQNIPLYLSIIDAAEKNISKEPYYLAYAYRTRGDVCLYAGDYSQAEKNFQEAAKIHTKERYLYEIPLDWYCIARSFSLAGKKNQAVDAILTALKYDKDAENTCGIASDYLAYSKILLKGNPTEEEKKLAEEVEKWSEKILMTEK